MAKNQKSDISNQKPEDIGTGQGPDTDEQPVVNENAAADLAAENAELKKKLAKATAEKGIPSVNKTVQGEQPRMEEIMGKQFAHAKIKKTSELTKEDIVSIEREIRRYVKRGGIVAGKEVKGGYVKGLTAEKKANADRLLKLIGRVDDKGNPIAKWDESIDVPGMSNALK